MHTKVVINGLNISQRHSRADSQVLRLLRALLEIQTKLILEIEIKVILEIETKVILEIETKPIYRNKSYSGSKNKSSSGSINCHETKLAGFFGNRYLAKLSGFF